MCEMKCVEPLAKTEEAKKFHDVMESWPKEYKISLNRALPFCPCPLKGGRGKMAKLRKVA